MAGSRSALNKRWARWLLFAVMAVGVWKVLFLGNLDAGMQSSIMATWKNNFYEKEPSVRRQGRAGLYFEGPNNSSDGMDLWTKMMDSAVDDICEDWLEKEDRITYSRNFKTDPIWVAGEEQDWSTCGVGCVFTSSYSSERKPDAGFGFRGDSETASVLRSMESSHYYPENNIDVARGKGYKVIMTTSLSSDVPVGYFSWAEYDIMAPLQPKTENALAAAFISNCGAHNFRLQALEKLQKLNIPVDSYGACHRNHDGRVDKVEALKRYKFSLAFENSNEEDYVTEKFFQSLVAGAVPVVVGAPNIQEFAPAPNSILHIKTEGHISSVVQSIKYLASNSTAYNETLKWKFEGPSDSFKALVDMAAVHSSCRLCIHLATQIQEKEEKAKGISDSRPCKCKKGSETVYHLYVRERGRFEMQSVFIRKTNGVSIGTIHKIQCGSCGIKSSESIAHHIETKTMQMHRIIFCSSSPGILQDQLNIGSIFKDADFGAMQRLPVGILLGAPLKKSKASVCNIRGVLCSDHGGHYSKACKMENLGLTKLMLLIDAAKTPPSGACKFFRMRKIALLRMKSNGETDIYQFYVAHQLDFHNAPSF